MLCNRLNDNGHRDYLVNADACTVEGTRGCLSMRSRSFGKRMQRIDLPQGVLEQSIQPQAGRADAAPTELTTTTTSWRLRQVELPSPIWASLVLGKA